MHQKVASFADYWDEKKARLKEKAMVEISSGEMTNHHEKWIDEEFQHLTFLQKFIVEEFVYEVMVEVFVLGAEASRPLNFGKQEKRILQAYADDIKHLIEKTYERHRLFQYIQEMDGDSIQVLVQRLADQSFSKGLAYGERQRKLRLI